MPEFREPTKSGLQAQAGWALLERSGTTSEAVVALDKYRDGCVALIPYAKDGTADAAPEGEVKLPAQGSPPSRLIPIVVERAQQSQTDCPHRFNIHDQHCLFCGVSRRQALAARGRKPELTL